MREVGDGGRMGEGGGKVWRVDKIGKMWGKVGRCTPAYYIAVALIQAGDRVKSGACVSDMHRSGNRPERMYVVCDSSLRATEHVRRISGGI